MISKLDGLRDVAQASFKEGLTAADPEEAVHRHFRLKSDVLRVGDIDYFLSRFQRVFVVGAGKASVRMARAVERILGRRVSGGIVITSRGQASRLRNILVREGGHPFPDHDGVRATEEMLELVGPLNDHDLVVCVISGGGSSLLTAPEEGISVSDLQRATKVFLDSGMTIHEINTVRKHISRVKGGKLAERIYPATVITLTLSDVIGDDVEVIASGPTSPDHSSSSDAIKVLKDREAWDKMPTTVREELERGRAMEEEARPGRADENIFKKVQHHIVGSNSLSLVATEQKARRMGMNTMILSSSVSGESREIARFYAAMAREIRFHHRPLKPPACLIAGGETTVTVTGGGRGGRCQEMALAAALAIADVPGAVFMAAGTDGIDGPTDAAGAVADTNTVQRAQREGLDPFAHLARNDSYSLFKGLGDLVVTGPTGTNVMDIHLLLVG